MTVPSMPEPKCLHGNHWKTCPHCVYPKCDGRYVDFQGAERDCLPGGEGCGLFGCPAAHPPQGGW